MQDIRITPVQSELLWEQPEDNRAQFEALLTPLAGDTDLVVLPEMFTTGFSMNALANAEPPGGDTEQWLQSLAQAGNYAVTGSIAVRDGDDVYNRMLFATPERVYHYDKRHLFRMGGEHKRYRAGTERVIVPWRGWRICLQVCYDLRFPVFARNRDDYDMLVYVANWPAARRHHWRLLLQARAVENQVCAVGVNRIGSDANQLTYTGDSLVVAADGAVLLDCEANAGAPTVAVDGEQQTAYRQQFPCHRDADNFSLE